MAKNESVNRSGVSQRGFTLVELLVVVAIIGLLLAILVPGVGRALERAKDTQCRSRMRTWAAAVLDYSADRQGDFPPSGLQGEPPPLGVGRLNHADPWYNELPRLMRQQSLRELNRAGMQPAPGRNYGVYFTCPSARADEVSQGFSDSDYVLSYGYNMWNDLPRSARAAARGGRAGMPERMNLVNIQAPAQYVVFGEMAKVRADTMAARDLVFRHNRRDAVNLAFADGHVESFLDAQVKVPESAPLTTNMGVLWDPESPLQTP